MKSELQDNSSLPVNQEREDMSYMFNAFLGNVGVMCEMMNYFVSELGIGNLSSSLLCIRKHRKSCVNSQAGHL